MGFSAFRTLLGAMILAGNTSVALAANTYVELKTNVGNFVLELYPEKAPQTVENFLGYVRNGFYKETIFHRVIGDFMVQGGGYTAAFDKKPTEAPVPNEANNGLKNGPGTVAMARALDPHSATSQFFINVADNPHLNFYKPEVGYFGYTVFGRVVKGMDTVQKIATTPTAPGGPFEKDVPQQAIVIEDAQILASAPVEIAPPKPGKPAKPNKTTKPAKSKTASDARKDKNG